MAAGLLFPHAAQAIQIVRRRRRLGGKKVVHRNRLRHHLAEPRPRPARRPGRRIRGHWNIEDRLHWVRDVTFGEDLSQIRTGNGPT